MSWLIKSSIGRKLVMSISGLALILFLTFHMSMNLVALFSEEGYNAICEFLGANWYALVGTMGLAFLFIVHIVYAFILPYQNRKARGNDRYGVVDKPKGVEWASQNMMALGVVVILGLALHFFNFWAKMQLAEIMGSFATPSLILFLSCCTLYGWLRCGSTCHMASGARYTPSGSTIRFGSTAYAASRTFTQRSSS